MHPHNFLSDGKPQTIAAGLSPGWICPVEAFKYLLLLFFCERRTLTDYGKPEFFLGTLL